MAGYVVSPANGARSVDHHHAANLPLLPLFNDAKRPADGLMARSPTGHQNGGFFAAVYRLDAIAR